MINKNEIFKKMNDLKKEQDSIRTHIKSNIAITVGSFALSSLGGLFLPLAFIGGGAIIGSFIHRYSIRNKQKKVFTELYELSVDLEKFYDQMEFLNKLSKLVDEHYKEAFKDHKYIKEEQICKQIRLNSPQQMDSKLIGELKIQTEKIFKTQEDNHYNILVLGRTGVGKSTLINIVLDLKGEQAAKENAVKPETGVDNNEKLIPNLEETSISQIKKKKFIPIEYSTENSSLVLLDSRGIEISKEYNIDIATEDIKQFIEERNGLDADPDKFVHCIWYLVTGKRFEDDEGNYVKSLKSLYSNFGLPIIFVYTQAIFVQDGDKIQERIESFMGEKINFIQIIARDMFVKTRRGKGEIKLKLMAFLMKMD